MAVKALKEKLEERLEHAEFENLNRSDSLNTNIVQFGKPESQTVSVVPEFAITLNDAKERIRMLQEFVKEMMVPGQDYGIISKNDKPSLFKAGAEKLTDIFGFSKHVEVINRVEDWEKGLFHYEVKATLVNKRTGYIEAEGVGSCNNKEKKYSTSPPCNTINTILKMAKKRAFIDAVLSATRSSGLFSQDLEDLADIEAQQPQGSNIAGDNSQTVQLLKSEQKDAAKPVTKSQLNKVQTLVTEKSIPVNRVKSMIQERYNVPESRYMNLKQADDFIKYLIKYKA